MSRAAKLEECRAALADCAIAPLLTPAAVEIIDEELDDDVNLVRVMGWAMVMELMDGEESWMERVRGMRTTDWNYLVLALVKYWGGLDLPTACPFDCTEAAALTKVFDNAVALLFPGGVFDPVALSRAMRLVVLSAPRPQRFVVAADAKALMCLALGVELEGGDEEVSDEPWEPTGLLFLMGFRHVLLRVFATACIVTQTETGLDLIDRKHLRWLCKTVSHGHQVCMGCHTHSARRLHRCSVCLVPYCTRACQKRDWREHRHKCAPCVRGLHYVATVDGNGQHGVPFRLSRALDLGRGSDSTPFRTIMAYSATSVYLPDGQKVPY